MALDYKEVAKQAQELKVILKDISDNEQALITKSLAKQKSLEIQVELNEDILEHIRLQNELEQNKIGFIEESMKAQETLMNERIGHLKTLENQEDKLSGQALINNQNLQTAFAIEIKEREKNIERKKEEIKLAQEYLYYQQKVADVEVKITKNGQQMFSQITGIKNISTSWLQTLIKVKGTTGAMKSMFKSYATGIASMVTVVNLLNKVYEVSKSLVFELDRQAAQTAAVTGRNREYIGELWNASVAGREFTLSLSETSEAVRSLYSHMSDFSEISEQGRREITIFASQMKTFNVSLDTTGQSLDNLIKGLGMSGTAAKRSLMEIHSASTILRLDVQKMQGDFLAVFGDLAAFGEKSKDVFISMMAASKATGVQIGKLNSTFGETMNTFEGSAEVAGRFNTILGKDLLNSVDLLFAKNPADRILMIKKALDASGKEWNKLGFFEKKAIAAAAGIQDMADATKIFGISTEAYELQQQRAKAAEVSQTKFNASVIATATFVKKMKIAWQNFAVAVQPVIEILNGVMDVIISVFTWINKLENSTQSYAAKTTLLVVALTAAKFVLAALGVTAGVAFTPIFVFAGILASLPIIFETIAEVFRDLKKDWANGDWLTIGLKTMFAPLYLTYKLVMNLGSALGRLFGIIRKKQSPAGYELPKVMASGFDAQRVAIKSTTPEVKKYTQSAAVMHRIQTKKGSPALWEINSVMAEGMHEQTQRAKQLTPEVNKLVQTNLNFAKSTGSENTAGTSTTNTTITSVGNSEISNKLTRLIDLLSKRKQGKGNAIKVDVNFLDIESTKRQFQDAVLKAIDEAYA